MDRRIVKGWRSRQQEQLDIARREALSFGSVVQGARGSASSNHWIWRDEARGKCLRPDAGADAFVRRTASASSEAVERFKSLKREVDERARANGEKTEGAVRMQLWRESQTPERLEQHRQNINRCKREQRARDRLDPVKVEAERLRRKKWREQNRDKLNAARREKRARLKKAQGMGPA